MTTTTPKAKSGRRSRPRQIIEGLNHHVELAADRRSQVKQAHWNVVGSNFIALHRLFDEQAEFLLVHVDVFAERVRALRGVARGTIRLAAAESPLPDLEARELPGEEAVRALLDRFETYSESLAVAIEATDDAGDPSTQDIYIEAQRQVDLHTYCLRSHLGSSDRHD